MLRLMVVSVALGLATSCYSPSWPDGIACGSDDSCPSDMTCGIDGRCHRGGPVGTAVDGSIAVEDACVSGPELCNGVDDDCDELIDEDFPGTGTPCDGPDADDCIEGTTVCDPEGASLTCSDDSDDTIELCNDIDDDCDGEMNEGYPGIGESCDSLDDDDRCEDDVRRCSASGTEVVCAESGPAIVELCNGVDDDCDEAIDEDYPALGLACDSGDADECALGAVVCRGDGTGTVCAETDERSEICDGLDNDCDGDRDEGSPPPCAPGNTCCGGRCCGFNEACCTITGGPTVCASSCA